MIHKAYKYRIYPNAGQRQLIEQHFGVCRLVYNMGLDIKQWSYQATGKSPSAYDLINQLPGLKEQCQWIRAVNAQSLQSALQNLDKAFKKFFKGAGYPKYKNRNGEQSFQCPQNVSVNFESNTLTIPKIKNIKIVPDRRFEGTIKTVTISRNPAGEYYASILVNTPGSIPVKKPITDAGAVGIDVGLKHFATLSNGTKIGNPRLLRTGKNKLRTLSKALSRKKKGSNNRKKQRAKLAKQHNKISNQRKDFLHKLSTQLVRENQAIIVEDLNLKGMSARVSPKKEGDRFIPNGQSRKTGLNKSLNDAVLGMFFTMLKYKSEWYGTTLIQIGRFEPSSKRCSRCKHKNTDLKLSDRMWTCSNCGAVHDRDENAAVNIKEIGLEQYCKNNTGKALPKVPVELP